MAISKFYNINRWLSGVNGYGLELTEDNYTVTLAAATEKTITVPPIQIPGVAYNTSNQPVIAIFSYKPATEFWIALNETAAVPAGGDFAKSTSTLNPSARVVNVGDVIHAISAAGGDMSVSFYGIQQR